MHKGKRIKDLLHKKKISTQEFSKLIGISLQYAYDIFEKEHLGTELLENIARALDVQIYYFFVESDKEVVMLEKDEWENTLKENEALKLSLKEVNEKLNHKEELLESNSARIGELKNLLLAYEEISKSLKR